MKTVLFVDKGESELWQSFQKHDYLFDEFQRRGCFAVCDWRSAGRSVATAIPTLQSILEDETEWTAVVVTDLRSVGGAREGDAHFDNPFDFERNYNKDANAAVLASEETPALVRLTQMLGGIPEKVDWSPGSQGAGASSSGAITHPRPDGFYQMLEDYRLGVPRPNQIVCITPRSVDEDVQRALNDELGSQGYDRACLRDFWQRNDYAAATRFVVCDRQMACKPIDDCEFEKGDGGLDAEDVGLAQEASERQNAMDWLRFWISTLTLLVSDRPSDSLKPYRLYRLVVNIDYDKLKGLFDQKYAEWIGARDQVVRQMEIEEGQLVRTEYERSQCPDCSTDITVDFDLVRSSELFSNPSKVGLIRDIPQNDFATWAGQRSRIGSALGKLLRAPRRALREASRRFREQSMLDPEELEYCVLNQTEKEELEDGLLAEEIRLAETTGRRAFAVNAYDESLESRSQGIRDSIGRRSPLKMVVGVFVASLVAVILGLLPYFIGLWLGLNEGLGAHVTVLLFVLVLSLVTLGTLVWQRYVVRSRYHDFNDWMSTVLGDMRAEARRLGDRISAYASYRKRWSILERQNHMDDPTERLRWLCEKDASLQRRIRVVASVLPVEADDDAVLRVAKMPWRAVSGLLEDESFYSVYSSVPAERPSDTERQTDLTLGVPFEFVRDIELDPLLIW